MRLFKSLLLASAAGLLAVSAAQAADLPTKKTPPAAEKPNCYASFYSWLDSTAADCPLSLYGITLYGTVDVGGGYNSAATPFNKNFNNGIQELISKDSNNGRWQAVPNGLSQSNVGVKIKEQIVPNWFIVGDADFGFDPYSFQFANGPESLEDNNLISSSKQDLISANGDSSRAGGIGNTRAYVGLSNPTFGTLTFGRQYALTNDLSSAYDPFGAAYAFSLIGTSGTVEQGTGETETARENTAFKYLLNYNGLRASAIAQVGGWSDGNGAQAAYQLGLGGDWNGFSVDAIYAYAKDAVKLGAWGGTPGFTSPTQALAPDTLKATLADVNAGVVGAKYKLDKLTLYGGYEYASLSSPSDYSEYYGTGRNIYNFNDSWTDYPAVVSADAFGHGNGHAEDLQVLWLGAKYGVLSNLDVAAGYYHEWQNDYDINPAANCVANSAHTSPKTVTSTGVVGQGTYASDCAGHTDAVSGLLDWRPVKRVDIYGGVMFSQVAGGMATGFIHTENTSFTSGVRVSF